MQQSKHMDINHYIIKMLTDIKLKEKINEDEKYFCFDLESIKKYIKLNDELKKGELEK